MSANSAVLSKNRNQLRIPKITPAGTVLLFVDLSPLTSHTPEEVEALAIEMGYTPELRIAEYLRNGKKVLEPALLIYQGETPASEGLLAQWEDLASLIQPSTAVHLRSSEAIATNPV